MHLLLTPGIEHGTFLEKGPIIRLGRAKSLKDILVRTKVPPLEKKKDCYRSCGGTRCELCKHAVTTETFISFITQREYFSKPNKKLPFQQCCVSFFMQNMLKTIHR